MRFKDNQCEEDRELEDLIRQMHSLSVRDGTYAALYAHCAYRFPNAVRDIPKPEYRTGHSMATYSYQAAAPPPFPQQTWNAHPVPSNPPVNANTNAAASFFRFGPRPENCSFCHGQGHRIRECPVADDYVRTGRATVINDRLHLPNGQPIPFDSARRGLKASIDAWLAAQAASTPTPTQTRVVFTRDPPPHLNSRNASTSRIEEVLETHVLQVKEAISPTDKEDAFSDDILEVFAAERKKKEDKYKASEGTSFSGNHHQCSTSPCQRQW